MCACVLSGSRSRRLRCIQWIFQLGPCEGCFPANSGGPFAASVPQCEASEETADKLASPTSIETGVPASFSDYGFGGGGVPSVFGASGSQGLIFVSVRWLLVQW